MSQLRDNNCPTVKHNKMETYVWHGSIIERISGAKVAITSDNVPILDMRTIKCN